MAIPTQKLKVLQPVVRAVAVDVVQLHAQRRAHPLAQSTSLAAIGLEPFVEEPLL